MDRYDIERVQDWRGWDKRIPALYFKSSWAVRVIPPFGGAMVRFLVESGEKSVSVYLDCYDELGCMGEPYWEVCSVGGDTARVLLDDAQGLLALIGAGLRE